MTEALKKAFKDAQGLPERQEEEIAELVGQKVSDMRWNELFARPESEKLLRGMAGGY